MKHRGSVNLYRVCGSRHWVTCGAGKLIKILYLGGDKLGAKFDAK